MHFIEIILATGDQLRNDIMVKIKINSNFFFFKFYFIFKLYNTVLVLPNIEMNPPQVYMCSPSWTLLPPPSPYHPSGSSQCTSPKHPVLCIEPGLATRFIHDIIHVSTKNLDWQLVSYMILYMFLQRYCWWTCRTLGMSINCCLVTKSCLTLQPHGLQPAKFLCGWDFPGRKPGMGRHFLLWVLIGHGN